MINSSLTVSLDGDRTTPRAFSRRGRVYRISEVQECWRLVGNWWDGHGEKTFFRVQICGGGIFELAYDHAGQTWQIHHVED